jgi:AraC-like DNA-binding protein
LNGIPSFVGATPAESTVAEIARTRFCLDPVSERARRSQVREFFGLELTRYDDEPEPHGPCHVDRQLQVLPGLVMMSGRGHGYRASRSRETMAAQGSEDIALGVNLGGPLRFTHGTQELVLGDGDAVLVSLADVYRFAHRPPGGLLALRVPRAQLAQLVTGVDDRCYRRIPAAVPALKFLLAYARVAEGQQRIACPNLRRLFTSHVYELMALVVGATRDAAELAQGRGLKAARLHAIKRDIAGNLDQHGLSVKLLAARHGLTPRCVQRLFETEGVTFTEYVISRRLERARRMLGDPNRDSDKISAIAWDCGFGDISHFNHLFRRRYGLSPSDVRAQARWSVQ